MIAGYIFATPLLADVPAETLKIVVTIDVFSLKESRVLTFGITDFLACSEEQERRYLLRAEPVVAIQPREVALLRAIVLEQDIILAGGDLDVDTAFGPSSRSAGRDDARQRILVSATRRHGTSDW